MIMKSAKWTDEEIRYMKKNYSSNRTEVICSQLGRSYSSVSGKAHLLGLRKPPDFLTEKWTDQDIQFLKDNFSSMTSFELAKALGKKRTIVRMKYKQLGLKKMDLEYWTDEMVKFLIDNYKNIGDVEIAEIFDLRYPKKKGWSKKHISKKRSQLDLIRSPQEIQKIKSAHNCPGGRCDTIIRNSASINMADGWIANLLAWRNKHLAKEIIRHPELIKIKRAQVLLNREIKNTDR